MDCGSVELYGYMAARDCLDPLLNYIFNVSRDDPIIVEQVQIYLLQSFELTSSVLQYKVKLVCVGQMIFEHT